MERWEHNGWYGVKKGNIHRRPFSKPTVYLNWRRAKTYSPGKGIYSRGWARNRKTQKRGNRSEPAYFYTWRWRVYRYRHLAKVIRQELE